jgi:hypothetical protein
MQGLLVRAGNYVCQVSNLASSLTAAAAPRCGLLLRDRRPALGRVRRRDCRQGLLAVEARQPALQVVPPRSAPQLGIHEVACRAPERTVNPCNKTLLHRQLDYLLQLSCWSRRLAPICSMEHTHISAMLAGTACSLDGSRLFAALAPSTMLHQVPRPVLRAVL